MLRNLFLLNLRWIVRDRVLQALVGVSLALLLLVPALSVFSLRQVQEVSITLSLSFISLMLFILSTFLGATSVWRDMERRYTVSVLTLPASRGSYILAKFLAIAFFLLVCASLLGLVGAGAIKIGSMLYPSSTPIRWWHIALALAGDTAKYILLASLAILFSTISTSFFLPFFTTVSLYLGGSASQDVYDYITTIGEARFSPLATAVIKTTYYVIPNFGAFNLKVYAVYPVPLPTGGVVLTFLYCAVSIAIVLSLATWIFSRRELP